MIEIAVCKESFSALRGSAICYLDNAATTQIPDVVLEAMSAYQRDGRGNPHRGLHAFAERATTLLHESRSTVAQFIGATADELLFTKSTTEGLNLLARSLGQRLEPGDEVVLTIFEHHANLLPWRNMAQERGFTIRYLPMSPEGGVDLSRAREIIGERTRVVAVCHASNVLGTILPIRELAELAQGVGAWFVLDAAQTVARMSVNVLELGCDAMAFGAHKMYGPEGIGALYVSPSLRDHLKPLLYGGGMVEEVLDDDVRYASDLRLFEAGSPNVTGAIGFAEACRFLSGVGLQAVGEHEQQLTVRLLAELRDLTFVRVYGGSSARIGVVSFSLDNIHSHDVAQLLADAGVATRAGYHCAAPLTRCLLPEGTVRVSFGMYNTEHDIERLITALKSIHSRFSV